MVVQCAVGNVGLTAAHIVLIVGPLPALIASLISSSLMPGGAVKSLANSGHFTVGHSTYKMVRGTMLLVAFDLTLLCRVPLVLQSGPFVGYFSPTNVM